jgi:hypothetical protein
MPASDAKRSRFRRRVAACFRRQRKKRRAAIKATPRMEPITAPAIEPPDIPEDGDAAVVSGLDVCEAADKDETAGETDTLEEGAVADVASEEDEVLVIDPEAVEDVDRRDDEVDAAVIAAGGVLAALAPYK